MALTIYGYFHSQPTTLKLSCSLNKTNSGKWCITFWHFRFHIRKKTVLKWRDFSSVLSPVSSQIFWKVNFSISFTIYLHRTFCLISLISKILTKFKNVYWNA